MFIMVVYATGFFFLRISKTSLTVMGLLSEHQTVSSMLASSGPKNASSCFPSMLYWETAVFFSVDVKASPCTIGGGRLFNVSQIRF